MKYMGSKARYAEQLVNAIQEELGYPNTRDIWIEPFVGGANMIAEIIGAKRKIGIDSHPYLISLLQAVQGGMWVMPDYVTEGEYQEAKKNSNHFMEVSPTGLMAWEVGFIGFCCSYSGKWFGGYARGNANNGSPRNYCLESKKNLLKQADKIKDVEFYCGDYKMAGNLDGTEGAIIYCDPPYAGTTKYKNNFNSKEFWQWCDDMVSKGFKVFVSEYNAPDGWRCIWEKQVNSSLTKNTGSKKATEKLFTK